MDPQTPATPEPPLSPPTAIPQATIPQPNPNWPWVVSHILGLLLLVSLGLDGYLLYQRIKSPKMVASPPPNSSPASTPTIPTTSFSSAYLNKLSENERKVAFLTVDTEVMRQNRDLIVQIATSSSFLEIGNCEPVPLAVQIRSGEKLIVKNSGLSTITLQVREKTYQITTKGTATVTNPLPPDAFGLIGYGCNNQSGGYLYVAKK